MKTRIKLIFVLLLPLILTPSAFGQTGKDTSVRKNQTTDSTVKMHKVRITMRNGDIYSGILIKKDENTITIKTENTELDLLVKDVISMENVTYTGKFGYANPHDTRYFFGPTGIPIKRFKGYYQNLMITTNFINFGITKNISVGGGFELISAVLQKPIWFFTPKVGFEVSKNVHIAGGLFMLGLANRGSASVAYGAATLGTSESNLTFGAGYGYFSGSFSSRPALMISGTHRLGSGIALLSENYIFPSSYGSGYFGIQGIRILSPISAFDFGVMLNTGLLPAIPFAGFSLSF